MMLITWEEWSRYAFSPDGSDTTRGISDVELACAIKGTGDLWDAAKLLSEAHGRIVARSDIADRVAVSPELQRTYEAAQKARIQRALGRS